MFLPVLGALVGIWILAGVFTLSERQFTLERVEAQLSAAITTLADYNELAEQAAGDTMDVRMQRRTAAIWRALLQYPAASIWVESDGEITGGQPPDGDAADAIVVQDARENFTVNASLPVDSALEGWWRSTWQRAIVLLAASVAFLVLSMFLSRALKQRTVAEKDAVTLRERAAVLSGYKEELEKTVAERTEELRESNEQLGKELTERKLAQAQLKEHDALLHSVAKGAAELLGTQSLEEATRAVLELVGLTIAVSRVHIYEIATGADAHLRASLRDEWCSSEMAPVARNALLRDLDLTTEVPHVPGPLLSGRMRPFSIDVLEGEFRRLCEQAGLRSFLPVPIMVDDKLWGCFMFIDSAATQRQWSWAETDTLQTLAGLYGVAVGRARYVKELADANMIVQNSPTILYRLRGEPPFPMVYVSHNIDKFGHDADALVGSVDWARKLMDPEDESRFAEAMSRLVDKDASDAAIEFRLRTGDGAHRWVENRYSSVRDGQGRLVEIEGMLIDITERKAADEKIALMARTDSLTGLVNRGTFIERLRQIFAATRRGSDPFAILYIDLDHFKPVNDTLGHQAGDALLREVGDRLRNCCRESDVVARLGGDEFAILQMNMREPANAGTLSATVQKELARPFVIDGTDAHVTASIGVCPYTPESVGPDEMLAQADLALYRSKDEGRNRYRFHSEDLDLQVLERIAMSDELRVAIEQDQLELYYQPQVELSSGRIVGLEALVRWHHPERGLLPAAQFIPVAEKSGAIVAVGKWVLGQACRQWREWRDAGLEPGILTINLSFAQLKNRRELLEDVKRALKKCKLAATDLSFDVTEATLAKATLMHSDTLIDLRALGVEVSIADFGSEYSSLEYLRAYQVNHLKIAQSFVDASVGDSSRAKTVRAIVNLARELGIDVIVQGVETAEQRDLSCTTSFVAQGMYFSEPLQSSAAQELLRAGRIGPPAASDRDQTAAGTLRLRK
jgi:diguanylate cyclase (GGDEF)-like protein/PAS domain S-box-containing protein